MPPKNVTLLFVTPAGDVEFPAKAAYPTDTTGPRFELKGLDVATQNEGLERMIAIPTFHRDTGMLASW
jgi:hypothetical protein